MNAQDETLIYAWTLSDRPRVWVEVNEALHPTWLRRSYRVSFKGQKRCELWFDRKQDALAYAEASRA